MLLTYNFIFASEGSLMDALWKTTFQHSSEVASSSDLFLENRALHRPLEALGLAFGRLEALPPDNLVLLTAEVTSMFLSCKSLQASRAV